MSTKETKILKIAKTFYNERKKNFPKTPEEQDDLERFRNNPHIIILSLMIQSGVNEKKCRGLIINIAKDIGYDFKSFYKKVIEDEDYFIKDKLKSVSFYKNNYTVVAAIKRIHDKYNSDVTNIWKKEKLAAKVISKFMDFQGVNIKKATMITNILIRDYGVNLEKLSAIDISPDVHVKRLMYRLGLIETDTPETNFRSSKLNYKVIYAAKTINPDFPGILDYCLWDIGRKNICTNKGCRGKQECKFFSICPKIGVDKID